MNKIAIREDEYPACLEDEDRELLCLLKEAVAILYDKDRDLIGMGSVERACVFRIGLYLYDLLRQSKFCRLDLDCEYNRHGKLPKDIKTLPDEEGEDKKVTPDLLLHKRGCDCHNKLVVEFKKGDKNFVAFKRKEKNAESIANDIKRLKKFTKTKDEGGEYQYQLGVFVYLSPEMIVYRYFKGGQELSCK